jgi:catechol 2,3-dioxygenase-like lactoylglutathione lyase family enzyme
MLEKCNIMAFVATLDAARAKEFYSDKLGLKMLEDTPFALVYDANGTVLRVTPVRELKLAEYTVLGWRVPDIVAAIDSLVAVGIEMKRYSFIQQDEHGVWTAPDGTAKVAWFQDPDGNILSVSQHEH